MFPSLDSWDAKQLESLLWFLKIVGAVGLLFSIAVGLWWNEFREQVSTAIEEREPATSATQSDAVAIKKEIANAPDQPRYLTPGTAPAPALPRSDVKTPHNAVHLFFGSSVFLTNEFPYTLPMANTDMLTLGSEGGKGWVSTSFFDKDGNVLCKIEKNLVRPNKPFIFYPDYPDDHTLVVYNHQDEVVLKVEYLNTHAFRISGRYFLRNGINVELGEGTTKIGDKRLDQITIMVRNFKELEPDAPDRPRLELQSLEGQVLDNNDERVFRLKVINTGRFDGIVTAVDVALLIDAAPHKVDEIRHRAMAEAVQAAHQRPLSSQLAGIIPSRMGSILIWPTRQPPAAEVSSGVKEGKYEMYAAGRLRYASQDGDIRESVFCYRWNRSDWTRYGGAELNRNDIPSLGDAAIQTPPPPAAGQESGEEKAKEGGNR